MSGLLSERWQAEIKQRNNYTTSQDVTICVFCLVLWNCCIMKHLRKETEAGKEAPRLAVSPGSAHHCSLFRLIAQDFGQAGQGCWWRCCVSSARMPYYCCPPVLSLQPQQRAAYFAQRNLCNVFSHLTSQSAEQDGLYKDIINIKLTKEQSGFWQITSGCAGKQMHQVFLRKEKKKSRAEGAHQQMAGAEIAA